MSKTITISVKVPPTLHNWLNERGPNRHAATLRALQRYQEIIDRTPPPSFPPALVSLLRRVRESLPPETHTVTADDLAAELVIEPAYTLLRSSGLTPETINAVAVTITALPADQAAALMDSLDK